MIPWIIATLCMILFLFLLGIYWGRTCHECGCKMNRFKKLDVKDQKEILQYFEQVEQRQPMTLFIWTCPNCHTVYDDYAGDQGSRNGNNKPLCKTCDAMPYIFYLGDFQPTYEIKRFREKNEAHIERIECLRCTREPQDSLSCLKCDTAERVVGCPICFTIYLWMPMTENGYRFLVPLKDHGSGSVIDSQFCEH